MKIRTRKKDNGDKPKTAKSTSRIAMATTKARSSNKYPESKRNLYSSDSVNVSLGYKKPVVRMTKSDYDRVMKEKGLGAPANSRQISDDKGNIIEPWRYKNPLK